jgi:hypothetical protein
MREAPIINGSLYYSAANAALPEAAMMIRWGLLLVLLWTGAASAATLSVEAVVSPAWVERAGGAREALATGAVLRNGDRVLTGPGARALLRMAEGSAVKLGENASLGVDQLTDKSGSAGRLVSGALDVAQGAFRFTTRFFGAPRAKRDLNIRIITVTAGIRGTDIWGKGSAERDVVCLIEGRIFVQHREQAFTMQQPLSFFIAGRDGSRQPVAPVPAAQLKEWAAETEIAPASGASRRGGLHRVVIAVAVDESTALSGAERLRAAGYPATVRAYRAAGDLRYDVNLAGLATAEDAARLESTLRAAGHLTR